MIKINLEKGFFGILAYLSFLSNITVFLLFALVSIAINAQPVADKASYRSPPAGPVIGYTDITSNSHAWLGIPYAQPPIAGLRWKAPRPIMWQEEKQTLDTGSVCTQSKPLFERNVYVGMTYTGSEDCLFLNIWSPSFEPDEVPTDDKRLPVMVWIHGGGDIRGSGDISGGKLAGSQDVIVVSMNYRLGPFGWLSHPALRDKAASLEDASGNYGTLDIIQTLQWVQDNISAFGGDPNRVTIFGVSAGGWNVFSLLVSPKAKGLFHRAIVQSGVPRMASRIKAEHFMDDVEAGHPQSSGELLLQLLQDDALAADRQVAKKQLYKMNANVIVAYLRGKTYAQLEQAYDTLAQKHSRTYLPKEDVYNSKLAGFIPKSNHSVPKLFNDGVVISKDSFETSVLRKRHKPVPIILGTTRDESKLFQALDPSFVSVVDGKVSVKDTQRYELANEYVSKLWKAAGADEPALALSDHQKASVFVYRFDWDDLPFDNGQNLQQLYGASHAMESHFLFGVDMLPRTNIPVTREFEDLSDQIMSYWSEFAYHGDPGKGRDGKLPLWKSWNNKSTSAKMIVLDAPKGGGIRMSTDFVNKQKILDQIARDPRVRSVAVRCQLYQDILHHSHTFLTLGEYKALEKGLCTP